MVEDAMKVTLYLLIPAPQVGTGQVRAAIGWQPGLKR